MGSEPTIRTSGNIKMTVFGLLDEATAGLKQAPVFGTLSVTLACLLLFVVNEESVL
jgi:hypothetical protein